MLVGHSLYTDQMMAIKVIRSTVKQALLTAVDPLRQQPSSVQQTMASDIQVPLVTCHYYKLPIGTRVCALTLPEPETQYIHNNPL